LNYILLLFFFFSFTLMLINVIIINNCFLCLFIFLEKENFILNIFENFIFTDNIIDYHKIIIYLINNINK